MGWIFHRSMLQRRIDIGLAHWYVSVVHPSVLQTGLSEAEFLSLPESLDRIEFIDGEVLLSPSPTYAHQRVVLRVSGLLQTWAVTHPPAAVGLAPLDVRLAPGRVVQPDLFVVPDGLAPDIEGPLDKVPAVVVEVLSNNRSYDRITKRVLYAEAGVREYWMVDPRAKQVVVVAGLESIATIEGQNQYATAVLPGFVIRASEIFG